MVTEFQLFSGEAHGRPGREPIGGSRSLQALLVQGGYAMFDGREGNGLVTRGRRRSEVLERLLFFESTFRFL